MVNATGIWDESYYSYPGRSVRKPRGNPVSDGGLNGQKSAEAIVARNFREGLNVRNHEYQGVREQCKNRRKLL